MKEDKIRIFKFTEVHEENIEEAAHKYLSSAQL